MIPKLWIFFLNLLYIFIFCKSLSSFLKVIYISFNDGKIFLKLSIHLSMIKEKSINNLFCKDIILLYFSIKFKFVTSNFLSNLNIYILSVFILISFIFAKIWKWFIIKSRYLKISFCLFNKNLNTFSICVELFSSIGIESISYII